MTTKATCRSCGRLITWVRTEGNRVMPIDRHPTASGNIALTTRFDPRGYQIVTVFRTPADAEQAGHTVRFLSHFATCPDADSWRGKR